MFRLRYCVDNRYNVMLDLDLTMMPTKTDGASLRFFLEDGLKRLQNLKRMLFELKYGRPRLGSMDIRDFDYMSTDDHREGSPVMLTFKKNEYLYGFWRSVTKGHEEKTECIVDDYDTLYDAILHNVPSLADQLAKPSRCMLM